MSVPSQSPCSREATSRQPQAVPVSVTFASVTLMRSSVEIPAQAPLRARMAERQNATPRHPNQAQSRFRGRRPTTLSPSNSTRSPSTLPSTSATFSANCPRLNGFPSNCTPSSSRPW